MSKNSVKQIFDQYKNEIITARINGKPVKDIATNYNLPVQTVSSFLIRNDIRIRRKLNKKDEDSIVNRYVGGESGKKIAKDYHITPSKVYDIIKNNGYNIRSSTEVNRKYDINEHYFDNIINQNQAYILGLLIADGSRSAYSYNISLSLQASDVNILEKIRNEIGSTKPLRFTALSKKNPHYSDQYVIVITNKQICMDLEKYGIIPRKDFQTTFPKELDPILYRHVIRGILDGDGFISKTEDRVGITGNDQLLQFVNDYISEQLGIHCTIRYLSKDKPTVDLRIAGKNQVKKFLDYIYKDAELYIDRKYKIYVDKYCDTINLPYVS